MFYPVQARKWLWLKLVGGTLLTSAFFMPTLEYGGCNANNQELWVLLRWKDLQDACWSYSCQPLPEWELLITVICSRLSTILFFLSPYLLGLLISLGVLSRFAGLGQSARFLDACQGWLLLFMSCIPILARISGFHTHDMSYYYACSTHIMTVSVGVVLLLYMLRANRRKDALFITSAWAGAAFYLYWCVAWYLYFCFRENNLPGDGPQIGLHLASLGFLTILIAATAEAILYTDLPWWRSLICLVTASLRRGPSDQPECKSCGYCLVGLTEPRCPECGTPFEPGLSADVSTPQRL